MDFVDLAAQKRHLGTRIDDAIQTVLAHGQYVLGPEVEALEHRLAERVGVPYCIGCASGTDALQLALMALEVRPDDEIILPGFTFIASAESVKLLGARPVYVDINDDTYLMDSAQIESAITPRTCAIMAVSLFGQCPDFQAISTIADRHGLAVIEDAAQSFGARQHGQCSGSFGTMACTSFFPSKPLGAYGDGGAVFTRDADLAKRVRQLARHGESSRYHHDRLGMNSRLDTIQAAILLAKLEIVDAERVWRRQVAERYDLLLHAIGIKGTPRILSHNDCVYAQYSIRLDHRDRMQALLKAAGIPTAVHYPLPLYRQPAVADPTCWLPVTEAVCHQVLSLPMHPYLTSAQQEQVVTVLRDAYMFG
nr:DegT/DnrJ/EryC1/StrS family aminotransferase [Aidingimonas halophila]